MSIDRNELEELSRDELLRRAEGLGIKSASTMTRPDLIDEIISASVHDDSERRVARGFLGLARDLVSRVVAKGLNLPDAAQRILASPSLFPQREPSRRSGVKPIPTVALAQVYASQGHRAQALEVLDQLRSLEPNKTDTKAAARLREQLTSSNKSEPKKSEPKKSESVPPANAEPSPQTVRTAVNYSADDMSTKPQDVLFADLNSPAAPQSSEPPASQSSEPPASQSSEPPASQSSEPPASQSSEPPASQSSEPPASRSSDLPVSAQTEPFAAQTPVPTRDSLEVTRDGLGFLVTWSVRPLTFARARVKAPRGELVLRAVHVRVSGEKAVSHVHDVAISSLCGQTRCECDSDCVACHVAVGWSEGALFFPLIA